MSIGTGINFDEEGKAETALLRACNQRSRDDRLPRLHYVLAEKVEVILLRGRFNRRTAS